MEFRDQGYKYKLTAYENDSAVFTVDCPDNAMYEILKALATHAQEQIEPSDSVLSLLAHLLGRTIEITPDLLSDLTKLDVDCINALSRGNSYPVDSHKFANLVEVLSAFQKEIT